jgi:hypothetical protein
MSPSDHLRAGDALLDADVERVLAKFSWETYSSRYLKLLQVPSFDLKSSLATDEVLHIADQKVDDADCAALSAAIRLISSGNMKQIYLSNNDIGDAGCTDISRAAAKLPNFEVLYLARNHISDAGVRDIAHALAGTDIWQLVLTENQFGDAGAIAIAEKVASDPSAFARLRWLFLDSSRIGDEGIDALSKAMVVGLHGIERLALQNCQFTNAGLASLADAIEHGALPHCEFLYVQNNAFDAHGKNRLRAAAEPRCIKVHFGGPPPLPGVDYR